MLAAVLYAPGDLRLENAPVPKIGPGEVLIRVKSCGFCATDFKAIEGIRTNVTFPAIVGHEPSGIVAAVGAHVKSVKEGDPVIVQPSGYCGVCEYCRAGLTHYCEHAFTTGGDGPDEVWPGAFAEYMRTTEQAVFKKPETISFDAAALTEPLSGAWKGVIQYSQMQLGEDVVIIGTGSIGLLCLMVAKSAGAGTLIAIDISDSVLENAKRLGATHCINPSGCNAKERVYEILPKGPDLVVEAAGSIQAVRLAVALRRRGTRWNVFGITTPEMFELEGRETHFLEGRMDASFGTTALAMQQSIRLQDRGLINTEEIITHRFSLEQIHHALNVMRSPNRNKIVINP